MSINWHYILNHDVWCHANLKLKEADDLEQANIAKFQFLRNMTR